MDDLIRRQDAIDIVGKVPDYGDGMVFEALSHAQRDVALLPSIDAVPVVRCKDCKWREIGACTIFTPDNWFCPKGERKEG